MSYDIRMEDENGNLLKVEHFQEGGTQPLGGTDYVELNITYNYAWYFKMFLDEEKGIRWLYGKKGEDCVLQLDKAIRPFKDSKPYTPDYWAPTPGNCVRPLKRLLQWAKQHPNGIFRGD